MIMFLDQTSRNDHGSDPAGPQTEGHSGTADDSEARNSLKDLEVNLNELTILEEDFKRAMCQYRNYSYAEAYELFSKVLRDADKLNEAETGKVAIKYLAKISVLRGDYRNGLIFLSRLSITPKNLSLLVRCLLLQYEKTRRRHLLHLSKELLYTVLSYCDEAELKEDLSEGEYGGLNFYFKNNLLLLCVFKKLGDHVHYYNLLDSVALFLEKYSKWVKNKHLLYFKSVAGDVTTRSKRMGTGPETEQRRQVLSELVDRDYDEVSTDCVDLVGEICKGFYQETLELRLEGSVNDIFTRLLEFYNRLDRLQIGPYKEAISVIYANDFDSSRVEAVCESVSSGEKLHQTRQGQREVKRRIIAMEGVSTKSVYLKNYWTSVCNFFYMTNFNNSLTGSAANARRDEEEDEEVVGAIYPSDIGRYLKHSETYYNLSLVRRLGCKGKRGVSEKTSLHKIGSFLRPLCGLRLTPISFSLKLLTFLLKNYRIGSRRARYQHLLAVVYCYVHNALVDLGPPAQDTGTVAASALYKFNDLFSNSSPLVAGFKRINLKYGARMLFVFQQNQNSAKGNGPDQGGKSGVNYVELRDKAYLVCLFNMYKLSRSDYLKRIQILYFHLKRLSLDRLEKGDPVYQTIDQYKYIMQYNKAVRIRGFSSNGVRSMAFIRSALFLRAKKVGRYTNALFNNLGNFVLSDGNLELQLARFVRKFIVVLAKYVDTPTLRHVSLTKNPDLAEEELNEVAALYENYTSKSLEGAFYSELQQFLLEVTCFVCTQDRCPSWMDALLLFYGDILSVMSFNLHKNISNIQVNDQFSFLFVDSFSHGFLVTLCSTLVVLINRAYYQKHRVVLSSSSSAGGLGSGGGGHSGGDESPHYINCLKEIELLNGYSLVLNATIARIYTNVVFIVYYLIHCLISDYNQPYSSTIYYLYVVFAQVVVIILSGFFNVVLYTRPDGGSGEVKIELSHLLAVTHEEPDRAPDASDLGLIDRNVMEFYYTYNNILDSMLQIDMLFREKDLALDPHLIPQRLSSYLYARTDGLEFADSSFGVNLSLSTMIFNKLVQMFNADFRGTLRGDLQVIHAQNHLIFPQYLALLKQLSLNLKAEPGVKSPRDKLDPLKDDEDGYQERKLRVDKDVGALINELSTKCINNSIGKEFTSPIVSLVYIHFKRQENFDNQLYLFKDLMDRMAMPHEGAVNLFTRYSNPLILPGPFNDLGTSENPFLPSGKLESEIKAESVATVNPEGNAEGNRNLSPPSHPDSVPQPSSDLAPSPNGDQPKGQGILDRPEASVDSSTSQLTTTPGSSGPVESPKTDDAQNSSTNLVLKGYFKHVDALRELLRGEDMFSYRDLLKVYEGAPEYDFMRTHRTIYLRILASYGTVDNLTTFDIESYSVEYLLKQLEVLNLASVVLRGSYDVLFLAIIKNFELLLSVLDVKQFNRDYSFFSARGRYRFSDGLQSSSSSPGSSCPGSLDVLQLIKRLMYLLYLTIHRYTQLLHGSEGTHATPVDPELIFYGEFQNPVYKNGDLDDPASFAYKLTTRIKLMHFIRIVLLVTILKKGLLIPSTLLFSDYCVLVHYLNGSMEQNRRLELPSNIEEFVLYSPESTFLLSSANYLYLLYLQTKIFDRIVKNVSLTTDLYRTIYAKILGNYVRYLRTLVRSKPLMYRVLDAEDVQALVESQEGPERFATTDSSSLNMSNLNSIFAHNYERNTMDDELIIVYYKLHCSRLRLLYLYPKLYYLAAPFAFAEELNSPFWTEELERMLASERYLDWSRVVESNCSRLGISRSLVERDILSFFDKIKTSPDSDIGCMVAYKLAYHHYRSGDVERSVELLEQMAEKIVLHNDFIRFAVNFEITFLKSCRKMLTNTCRMLIAIICEVVHHSKGHQDKQVITFKQRFYGTVHNSFCLGGKQKGRPKAPKKGAGNWIFAGHEQVQALDLVHRLIQVHVGILQKLNRKFREVAELDRSSLLFSTLNHAQNLLLNTLTYCFMFLVYACPHVLSLPLMYRVLDAEDVQALVESQEVVSNKPNHSLTIAATLHELITSRADQEDVYEYLEKNKIFHHGTISSEYSAATATLDLRVLKQLHTLWSMRLFMKPVEITNKLSEIFIDACNRLLYIVPADPTLLGDAQEIELPSGHRVQISEEWAVNQRITTTQRASYGFNEATAKPT